MVVGKNFLGPAYQKQASGLEGITQESTPGS